MPTFEYKVVPAPVKGTKAKGAKTTQARFAVALGDLMNDLGAAGWEYLRADTLPCETRQGLTGKTTVFQNMLVFRRVVEAGELPMAPAPVTEEVEVEDTPEEIASAAVASLTVQAPEGEAPAVSAIRDPRETVPAQRDLAAE
ncbi:hypothetical protein ACMU_13670 [Actibacterium mucosum KCTC 23349]|uniref:DUF4177 domain-containing protein n=1 Tax=Actibacterium mucosum KCTC 23349 TaxID=1454373 RepID=A0A037ZGZ6_9RHOB|nr:hypothetical protein [Actibacterium mucosum]KAJ55730.1 hypothetical protein ACMU_13670 [Actibacterium mucosum KCTC 23349]